MGSLQLTYSTGVLDKLVEGASKFAQIPTLKDLNFCLASIKDIYRDASVTELEKRKRTNAM